MYLPNIFKKFQSRYPAILDAYQKVGDLCSEAGPLDEKAQHLIQLGTAIGAESKGAVRSHARRALKAGASKEEVLQTILLSMTIVGFPGMIAAFDWVEDVTEQEDSA
jgi:alkylhydroperoxidase/carboxymuconolactone decarboxylase family protein YurZ